MAEAQSGITRQEGAGATLTYSTFKHLLKAAEQVHLH